MSILLRLVRRFRLSPIGVDTKRGHVADGHERTIRKCDRYDRGWRLRSNPGKFLRAPAEMVAFPDIGLSVATRDFRSTVPRWLNLQQAPGNTCRADPNAKLDATLRPGSLSDLSFW